MMIQMKHIYPMEKSPWSRRMKAPIWAGTTLSSFSPKVSVLTDWQILRKRERPVGVFSS